MRSKVILFSIFFTVNVYAYEFENNSDYAYAMGIGKTQEEAEMIALSSLSNSLKIEIKNNSSYNLSEINGKVTENYNRDIKTKSSMCFDNVIKTLVEQPKKNKFIAYKYFNKREYINKQESLSKYYLNKADSLFTKGNKGSKHEKNIIMGYYYNAYEALNTPLMNVLTDNNKIKNEIIRKDSLVYISDYGIITLKNKNWQGYYATMCGMPDPIYPRKPIAMFGFEYLNEGIWKLPIVDSKNPNDENIYRDCFIAANNPIIHIRILYEIKIDGNYYKIDVPERWYFADNKIQNLKFLD